MAGIPTHRTFLKRVIIEPYLYDGVLAIAALFPVSYAVHKAEGSNDVQWANVLWLTGLMVFTVAVLKIVATARKQGLSESRHELEGCLHTLHAVLTAEADDGHGLRITVHVPIKEKTQFQQVLEYVGDPRGSLNGKTVGRTWDSKVGIIGRVYREEKEDCIIGKRETESYQQYIKDLQEVWHYSEAQARRLDPAAMTWMAIRLKDSQGEVQGIVYCDSTQPEFFTNERRDTAIAACAGIARYVSKRYK